MRRAITLCFVLSVIMSGASLCAEDIASTANKGQQHALDQLLEIAKKREKEIHKTVQDYTCTIVKRERINGQLQEHRFIQTKVRVANESGGVKNPLHVHMTFRAPKQIAGRQLVFIEGQNKGRMMVQRGGDRLKTVTVNVDPNSDLARTESLMHVGHLGFDGMVSEIIAHLQSDKAVDPTSSNTTVRVSRNARINDRSCTSILITHPHRAKGLTFHRAEVFADNEYHLPVRVAAYDWPKEGEAEGELLAEFTYTKVKVNVGLTEADFTIQPVRTASRPETK